MSSTGAKILEARDIVKQLGQGAGMVRALKGVSLSLQPGDMIALGSPAGTNIERANPRWIKAGDVGACIAEGIGEQKHKFVAQP